MAASTRPVVLVTAPPGGSAVRWRSSWPRTASTWRCTTAAPGPMLQATVDELRALGAQAQAFQADLSDEAACRALVPSVAAHFERLDAIVNSASTFEYDEPKSFSVAAMEKHWSANTAPAIILAQRCTRSSISVRRPAASSTSSTRNSGTRTPDYFSYTLSKAALQSATVMLAQALAPRVRVCGVAPGVTLVSVR